MQPNGNQASQTNDMSGEKGHMPLILASLAVALVSAIFDLSGPIFGVMMLAGWFGIWAAYLSSSKDKKSYVTTSWKVFTWVAAITALAGLAVIAKGSLDMIDADTSTNTEIQYRLIFGFWMVLFGLMLAVPGIVRFAPNIRAALRNAPDTTDPS